MDHWITTLLADPTLCRMGHGQRAEDANLGLGWVYYGLVRAFRPRRAVVIGSWRGFVPLVLGKAMQDNLEGGEVIFIDPSRVDDFWCEPAGVTAHFARFGVANIRHHLLTTQQFADTPDYAVLDEVGLLFVDGLHTEAQARFDHEAFADKLAPGALVCFHDSVTVRRSRIYGEHAAYEHRVRDYMDALRQDSRYELFDLAAGEGLTLLRRRG